MSLSIHGVSTLQKAKFLLNSRTTFVTVPCNCNHSKTITGIPYTEDMGLICRIPWTSLHSHILGYSPRGTRAGSGYGCFRFFLVSFSRTQEINQTDHRPAILEFNRVLIITILPWFIPISTADEQCWSIPKRQKQGLRCRTYWNSSGILTAFPFPLLNYESG